MQGCLPSTVADIDLSCATGEELRLFRDTDSTHQQSIEAIAAFVAANPNVAVQVPFSEDDIGGNLLSITSQGLYSDPRDAIREFAQNGVDAGASEIIVRFSGRDVAVQDDGSGMDFYTMVEARRFARSNKSAEKDIGFRGIGIYAGFHLCDTLTIVSQQPNSEKRSTMRFDFASMRETLDPARESSVRDTGFAQIIYNNSVLFTETLLPDEILPKGRTLAVLESLTRHAYHELSNITKLDEYLRTRLPVPIDDAFPFKSEIEQRLLEELNYRTVELRITDFDSQVNQRVTRSFATAANVEKPKKTSASSEPAESIKLFPPVFRRVVDANKSAVAVMWSCMSSRKTLRTEAGLFFKKMGFTIGNGMELRTKFEARPAVYQWYVGEIYVTDPLVKPTAARDWFENTAALQGLMLALDKPTDEMLRFADAYSARERVKEKIGKVIGSLPGKFPTDLNANSESNELLKMYEFLGNAEDLLKVRIPKDPDLGETRAKRDVYLNIVVKERERISVMLSKSSKVSAAGPLPEFRETADDGDGEIDHAAGSHSRGGRTNSSNNSAADNTNTKQRLANDLIITEFAKHAAVIGVERLLIAIDDAMRTTLDKTTYERIVRIVNDALNGG